MRLDTTSATRVPTTPANELFRKIGGDLLRMPGVKSGRLYGAVRPNEIGLVAVDERAAAALVGVLEPKVQGIDIRVYVGNSQDAYRGAAGRLADRLAIIDALTGVWGHKASIMPRGSGTVTFWTIDQPTIDRLDPLLLDRFDLGVDPRGWKVIVNVRWKPGVPA